MNEYFFNVNFQKNEIKTNLPDLVQNDYKSTKLNFTFDKEGTVEFKLRFPDGTGYIDKVENNIIIFDKGLLSQNGKYKIELSLYNSDQKLTNYATKSFSVRKEIVDGDDIVELDNKTPILSKLIEETNNLDVNVSKENNTSTISVTKKDGSVSSIQVFDGSIGEKGEKGDPGSINFVVVKELPTENIDLSAIYVIPTKDPKENNKYEEFIYVEDKWESLGTPSIDIDLSNYYTKEETQNITGKLNELSTEDKNNIVSAINSVAKNDVKVIRIPTDNNQFNLAENQEILVQELNKMLPKDKSEIDNSKWNYYFPKDEIIFGFNKLKHISVYISTTKVGGDEYCYNISMSLDDFVDMDTGYTGNSFMMYDKIQRNPNYTVYCKINDNKEIIGVYSDRLLTKQEKPEFFGGGTSYLLPSTPKLIAADNTVSYTPTGDYNPATKKYVDDNSASNLAVYNYADFTGDNYDFNTLSKEEDFFQALKKVTKSGNENGILVITGTRSSAVVTVCKSGTSGTNIVLALSGYALKIQDSAEYSTAGYFYRQLAINFTSGNIIVQPSGFTQRQKLTPQITADYVKTTVQEAITGALEGEY